MVVEFVGEMDRPVPPVIVSTSAEEGEWYGRHLSPELLRFLVHIDIVPASTLREITEPPLLKRALESAKQADDEPKTPENVRFTTGVGHNHLQIMVDAQTSTNILKNIARVVAKYSRLKSDLQEIENYIKSARKLPDKPIRE